MTADAKGRLLSQRRSELEIAAEILRAIFDEERDTGCEAHASRVQARVYLNWKVFKRHISRLRERELVASHNLTLTKAGMKFLNRYSVEVRSFLREFDF